jgi:DNA-binding response OmpR family regulator
MDHGAISRYLQREFGAKVIAAADREQYARQMQAEPYDLILVNRILDGDGTSGLDLIRERNAIPELADTPIMLVSNYPDAQKSAESLGALAGFGKSALASGTTRSKLAAVLEPEKNT